MAHLPAARDQLTIEGKCHILTQVAWDGHMRAFLRLTIGLLLLWALPSRAEPTFSDAVGMLGQERSYAEAGAALVKRYSPDDIEARRLYAEAKAAFDGLIEQLLADLAQNKDPTLSTLFRARLEAATAKRFAFSEHADKLLRVNVPEGAKPSIVDALAKVPAELVKELFAGGMAIWKEWRGIGAEQRKQVASRLESQRWKPFSEIAPAL